VAAVLATGFGAAGAVFTGCDSAATGAAVGELADWGSVTDPFCVSIPKKELTKSKNLKMMASKSGKI
jgi:hypothetical protein